MTFCPDSLPGSCLCSLKHFCFLVGVPVSRICISTELKTSHECACWVTRHPSGWQHWQHCKFTQEMPVSTSSSAWGDLKRNDIYLPEEKLNEWTDYGTTFYEALFCHILLPKWLNFVTWWCELKDGFTSQSFTWIIANLYPSNWRIYVGTCAQKC